MKTSWGDVFCHVVGGASSRERKDAVVVRFKEPEYKVSSGLIGHNHHGLLLDSPTINFQTSVRSADDVWVTSHPYGLQVTGASIKSLTASNLYGVNSPNASTVDVSEGAANKKDRF